MDFDWKQIKDPILKWYYKEHRELEWRKTKEPYCIWVSEIMLQQTRVEAVNGFYTRFMKDLPNIQSLANVSEDRLMKLWEGLGYYNRARNLKKAAAVIMNQYNGTFPSSYEDILNLPGIGEYTASAICSICYNMPTPAVDGNVLRVTMRILNCYDCIDDIKTKSFIRNQLISLYSNGNCSDLTQAMMELGAMICIPNGSPKCAQCPLNQFCKAYEKQTFSELPIRKKKTKRKLIDKTVFILHNDSKYGIRKRDSKGLLANMWEFCNVDKQMSTQEVLDYISKQGYGPVMIEKQIPYTHIFTHVQWNMTAYYIKCNIQSDDLLWVTKDDFKTNYALPTAFRVFIERED